MPLKKTKKLKTISSTDLTTGEIRVVQAVSRDIPGMIELLEELFSQEAEFRPEPEKQKKGLKMILCCPNTGRLFVAKPEGDDKILGMVSILFTVSTALGGKASIIEDMIVTRDYRGRGIGSLLLSEAVRFACEKGVLRLSLLTDHDNAAAQFFYEKHQFKKSEMILMRRQ
ncbi:MAG: GNAT family N-acetyltransferase [Spirochaetales bacterium]|uniref:GNAT family N-acetyltransferase n=1 Tax=Candidatus Thalassospirochaeta sargassi TaxID=3119039 RepID=A0AAJ1ICV7_9SPIO|nr:GNAT family N-acetyltransferase [Spirochaetales bacterium]